jgi:hypothetical protein
VTPRRAALLLTAHALSRQEPVSERLRSLPFPEARQAASEMDAGRLAGGLRFLGVDEGLGGVVARWPRALGPALRRLDSLPSVFLFRVHLAQTLGYFGLVLLVQLAVNAVLKAKVLGVFHHMGGTDLFIDLSQAVIGLVFLVLLPVGLWVALGASGWARLPGWGRHLARASQAAAAAALVEAGAPEDVRAAARQDFRLLPTPASSAADLEELFLEARAQAERALTRFLVAVRVVGFTLLTLLALAIVLSVLGTVARLPWVS